LSSLFADWDADPGDVDAANRVLFGCHDPCAPERDGIHDYLRKNLLPAYGGVKYVVVVGDDRVVPLARVPDLTGLLKESRYVQRGGLTESGTRVGEALNQDNFLSDDLLGVTDPVSPTWSRAVPALSVGRLVEKRPRSRPRSRRSSLGGILTRARDGQRGKVLSMVTTSRATPRQMRNS
jgi:hypothetical protein